MEKAKELFESIVDIHTEIRKESENYLRRVLEKNDNNISFDEIDAYISVCYDGGGHPEYNSNVYSFVKGVFLNKDGDICLETDDCFEYSIKRISWDEVYGVAMFIYDYMGLK